MTKNKIYFLLPTLLAMLVLAASIFAIVSSATTVNVLDGKVSMSDTQNTIKVSSGTVTATAKGSLLSKKTNTITITNNSEVIATLAFNYSVDKASSFTIDGASSATSGGYSKLLNAGESVVIAITSNSGFSNLTVTLTLTNIELVEAASSSEVTISYDSTLGNVTADGDDVSSGIVKEVSLSTGIALEATPTSGKTFVGWIDTADNKVISKTASFTYKPADDITIKAVFVDSNISACFWANDATYLFENLNSAIEYTEGVGSKVIVLAANGTLPAGDYTIPSGVTFLIPCDSDNTVYKTSPNVINSYTAPTKYRTLILASNANLYVDGELSVAGAQSSQQPNNGSPTGALGFIVTEENSQIIVNNGGKLYAWGYITGFGNVTADTGSAVYESFQARDWRGGGATSGMVTGNGKTNKVFPISQYYMQNIEIPMTLKYGAEEYGYYSVAVKLLSTNIYNATVPFIGENGMFHLTTTDGEITKQYLAESDRMRIDITGDLAMQSLKVRWP